MENKKTNWGAVIAIVLVTVAVLTCGVYIALKVLKKKKKACCCEDELDDADICVLDDEIELEAEPQI